MEVSSELIKACKKGDRRAQFELYQQCYSPLMAVCMRYESQQEDARALLNKGFFKVLKYLDKYKPQAPFQAWAKRIMINTVIDEYRRNRKHKERVSYTEIFDYHDHVDLVNYNAADEAFDAEDIEQLLYELPEMTRKVFNLFAIDGYAHKEIAAMLSVSEGTSKWHVSSARRQLRALIHQKLNPEKTKII